jgi:hypothetical protein
MEYIGNQPNPNPFPYDDFSWPNWWIPNLQQPDTSVGGWTPTTVLTPGGTPPDVDANGNPVFRTDVVDTAPPVETIPSDIGDPDLARYLASLPQGQIGGTGANFSTTGWDVADWGGGEGGGDPKFETTAWDTTDPDDPLSKKKLTTGGTSFQTGPMNSLVSTPTGGSGGDRGFPVSIFPIIDKIKQVITGGGGGGGGTGGGGSQQPGGKQQQQPGVGKLLAALPMLAAFQGGTTTTPAPYAHLGPHTPVAPVFKPQARGNPIPSIGQLLAGVR